LPYLNASAMVIDEEALYQVYAPLPFYLCVKILKPKFPNIIWLWLNCQKKIISTNVKTAHNTTERLRERTEPAHHSMVFYFRCSVYWRKGNVIF